MRTIATIINKYELEDNYEAVDQQLLLSIVLYHSVEIRVNRAGLWCTKRIGKFHLDTPFKD